MAIDPRTTITEVVALADGRMLAECHANSQAEFDAWLSKNGLAGRQRHPDQPRRADRRNLEESVIDVLELRLVVGSPPRKSSLRNTLLHAHP